VTTRRSWDDGDELLAAAAPLEIVRRFVNTRDIGLRRDRIETPRDLALWLTEGGLAAEGIAPTAAEVDDVRKLREAVREMLLANAGMASPAAAAAAFNAVVSRLRLRVEAREAEVVLAPAGRGVSAAMEVVVAAVVVAQGEGLWPRLKACAGEGCHWALFDRTRNLSRTWCDVNKCGARSRSRSYRRRRREREGSDPSTLDR
jgi:predicted RNA-binding Zn ribbon-like protein